MPGSVVGPSGPYDLLLQDTASSPTTTVGLMLDLDEQGAPRMREFRVPPIPPRQSQGFLADTSLDPLVDYIFVQDDWSGGAIRPYYRDGDRRYAEAHNVDARWEGVLALGMNQSQQLSIVLPNASFETGTLGGWSDLGGGTLSFPTSAPSPRTGTYSLGYANTGSATGVSYSLPVPASFIGRSITFGGYKRGTGSTSARFDIVVTNGSGSVTGSATTSTTAWGYRTETTTIGAGATAIAVRCIASQSSTTAYFDDLIFYISGADTAVGIVEAAGRYYTAVGGLVLIWNETNDFWEASTVEAAGTQATGIASYKNKVYIGYGLSTAYIYGVDGSWTVASGGSGNNNYGQFFVVGNNRLFKNDAANNVVFSTTDPASGTAWAPAGAGTVGEVSAPITGLYWLANSLVVGTEVGLHVMNQDEGIFQNTTNQYLADPDTSNFRQGVARGSWLYLTTAKQGLVRFNGYALEDLSEIFMAPRLTNYGGRVRAITQDQHQMYLLVDTPTVDTSLTKTTRLMSLRNVGGEWQLHTLANVDIADINTLAVAGAYLYGLGRLSINAAGTYRMSTMRWKLPEKSAAPFQDDITVRDLQVTGTINLPIFHAAGVAALIKVELMVEDTDSTNTVAVKFGLDGAAPDTTTLGTTTAVTTTTPAKVTMNASSLATPTNAYGRFWQFQLVLTRDSTQAAGAHESPKVYAFIAHFVLAPTPVPAWEVFVRLLAPLKTGLPDARSKDDILSNLNTLETQAYPITLVEDFDQDDTQTTHYVRIREWERVLEDQEVHRGRPAIVGELYRLVLQKII